MLISRRALLTAGIMATWRSRPAIGQAGPRVVVIEVQDLLLYPNTETLVAVNTSGPATSEVSILDPDGKTTTKPMNFSTKEGASLGAVIDWLQPAKESTAPIKHTIRITTQPIGASVAVALTQTETPPPRGASQRGRGDAGARQQNLDRLLAMAKRAHFVEDPARAPGHFVAALATDASVLLKIWRGEKATGTPTFQKIFSDLSSGDQQIPWDLKSGRGALVQTGRYLGWLVCTPKNKALNPTNLIASFGVSTS